MNGIERGRSRALIEGPKRRPWVRVRLRELRASVALGVATALTPACIAAHAVVLPLDRAVALSATGVAPSAAVAVARPSRDGCVRLRRRLSMRAAFALGTLLRVRVARIARRIWSRWATVGACPAARRQTGQETSEDCSREGAERSLVAGLAMTRRRHSTPQPLTVELGVGSGGVLVATIAMAASTLSNSTAAPA